MSRIWADCNAAITGGSGALGQGLALQLLRAGCRNVTVLSRRPGAQNLNVRYVQGDILNFADLRRGLAGCQVVFHLAAAANADGGGAEPLNYIETNTLGTARVLEACRLLGVEKIVYASTSHVYGPPLTCPVSESHPTNPLSLYAASKLAGEVLVQGYAATYRSAAIVARLSNLYGGAIGPNTVIGRALDCVLSGEPIHLRSWAEIRDFLYIDDAAEALLRLAASESTNSGSSVVNVSTGVGVRISEVVSQIVKVAEEAGIVASAAAPTGTPDREIPEFVMDGSRLQSLTDWMPATSLRHGLVAALGDARARRNKEMCLHA